VRKLCNNLKKTTGVTGENADRVHCCIEIEQCIQRQSNSGILRVSSAEGDEFINKSSSKEESDDTHDLNEDSYLANEDDIEGGVGAGIPPPLTFQYLPLFLLTTPCVRILKLLLLIEILPLVMLLEWMARPS
jgi:hypothetical protein